MDERLLRVRLIEARVVDSSRARVERGDLTAHEARDRVNRHLERIRRALSNT